MAGEKKRSEAETRKILEEARARFKRCQDWEATFRPRFLEDIKFDAGDARNNYQWDADYVTARGNRPSLTINRTRQHNLDILNDARQSKVAVKVRPLREGASYDSAQILDGIIKHIEYISNADSAYQIALGFAVRGGIGWIRLVTDYTGDDTFDQEIFIRPVKNPLSVMIDPDISEFDGSDALFGFVFTDMPKAEFDKAYPKYKDLASSDDLSPSDSWILDGDRVRIAEYFRCVKDEDTLVAYQDPATGQQVTKRRSELDKALLAQIVDDPSMAERTVVMTKVEHFKIIGDQIAEEKVWPGKYIPLLRCVGEETIIDGQMDRKGHTRALLDMQRSLNYNASASIEYGALQTKTPYTAPAKAIEGYEEYWKVANTENFSVLPWNHVDDDGNVIPPPQRIEPPAAAPVFVQGARDAVEWMYLASGQNQADFGQPSNEKSGVAIEARQRQGDNATYHYLDHQAIMIRYLGKQLVDLIGKVYDTPRLVPYRDDAGNEGQVQIDPEAQQHFQQEKNPDDGATTSIMNPKMGVYDVQADVGPAYATRRAEAFAAFSQLLAANKELFALVGDIWMRFSDVPGAEEASERLKRMVPAQAMHDGPAPDVVKLQGQLQEAQTLIHTLTQKLGAKEGDTSAKFEKNAIDAYKATTDRIDVLKEALATDPQGVLVLIREVIEEAQAQSAGGNVEDHMGQPTPGMDQLHPNLGGQLQGPAPHAPPVDPNNMIPSPDAPAPAE